MARFDWTEALDALNEGHSLAAVEKIRKFMRTVGITALPLHATETARVRELRLSAARQEALAAEIEARAHGGQ